ncbi:MAG: serine hydrolase [Ignavibacteriae bacterium]|nr:serine hydrolase [Ignavibacteriota bacterium]
MTLSKLIIILLGSLIMSGTLNAQNKNLLDKIISENYQQLLPAIQNLEKYEIQIIYTKIEKDENGKKKLQTFSFNENSNKYFYPASTVKFPAAILALEKLNDLNISGVNKFTHLSIDSVYENQTAFNKEFKDECGYPNIADYIKRIFLVSDNQAFNRLFDFLGQKEINQRLRKRGFDNTKILHRLEVTRTEELNKQNNPINFYDENNNIIYQQPAKFEGDEIELKLTDTKKGIGYYADGVLINEPKDFSQNNFFGLRDQHNLMIRIIFPELFDEMERFNLTEDDYKFLNKYMCMLPRESECPKYDSTEYYDGYVKFFMFGNTKEQIPTNIKIFSKSGLAYGYLIDNAYIKDVENNVEFFLSAVIHVNEDQIYNDDKYEYDEIGLPFLANLGKIIYNFEINKEKQK